MKAIPKRQYAKHERQIGRMLNAITYFVEDRAATDDEVRRLFEAQLEFAHKLKDLRAGFDCVGIDSDPESIAISRRRIAGDAPLFAEVAD